MSLTLARAPAAAAIAVLLPVRKAAENIAPVRWKVAPVGCGLAIGHGRGVSRPTSKIRRLRKLLSRTTDVALIWSQGPR